MGIIKALAEWIPHIIPCIYSYMLFFKEAEILWSHLIG